jgi:hypothetical protein
MAQIAESSKVSPRNEPQLPKEQKVKAPIKDHEKVLQSILDRTVNPLETTSVTVQVYGIFSLPEPWKAKVATLN